MNTSVFCVATNEKQAYRILDELKTAGFGGNDISVLFPHHGPSPAATASAGAATGGGAGAAIGAALGWLAGVGLLAIPGIGPFIAAGPIMVALSGAVVGGAVGGVTGALVGMGIPEFEATHYERRIKNGSILISAHARSSDQATRAKEIFGHYHAEDISSVNDAEVTSVHSRESDSR